MIMEKKNLIGITLIIILLVLCGILIYLVYILNFIVFSHKIQWYYSINIVVISKICSVKLWLIYIIYDIILKNTGKERKQWIFQR